MRDESHATCRAEAGRLYDLVGARAYGLARLIVGDDALAERVVAAAFAQLCGLATGATEVDLMIAVRRRAVAIAAGLDDAPAVVAQDLSPYRAVRRLPEPQREVVELVMLGKVAIADLAVASSRTRRELSALVCDALHAMRGMSAAT